MKQNKVLFFELSRTTQESWANTQERKREEKGLEIEKIDIQKWWKQRKIEKKQVEKLKLRGEKRREISGGE